MNNFAISSGGIGEALEKSASSLDAANNTIDESIALITAANTVVQNPDVVGTAFKTISMRIRGAKTELEDAGLETDGMVESTAKLRSEILALSGVDIMENATEFKSTYAIMDELAVKWENLTDIQQASVTELIAGKRQGNIVSSLMSNFDVARSALDTSLKSAGSAMREHEKWQQSLEARLNSLKASWQALSQTFMDSDFLKFGIDVITKFVDVIDTLIDRFGVLGTTAGGISLYKIFKNGFALDADGNKIGAYFNIFKGLGGNLKAAGSLIKETITSSGKLGSKLRDIGQIGKMAGQEIGESFSKSKQALKTMAKDIGTMLAIMGIFKAVQDIISWVSELGEETETAAEKFDRISDELSSVESELSSLKSEFSNVENQIDALLSKGELTFTDKEELERLKNISSELERQIQLTETLQKSLQESLNGTSIAAYNDYAKNTSFYSTQSRAQRKEEAEATGSSIGNIVGLVLGAVIGTIAGGNTLLGAGIGSAIGGAGGSAIGGAISDAKYSNEATVGEMIDKMHLERVRLEKAQEKAYKAYTDDRSNENKEAWEEASVALNDYNTALANHITQLSEYYNAIDYSSLTTKAQREEYLKMGDDIDKYNIEMGVSGAKTTAFDRIFDEELITKEAKELKQAVESALNSGEDIRFYDLDPNQFTEMKKRLADMGLTLTDVISYFEDLKVAQEEASDYETYDIVSNIAALSDGVTALTDAFVEFNEQGIVTANTLVELHKIFGNLGDDWTNYVDIMTSGIYSIEEARETSEQLVEAHLNNLFSNGGIKFNKFDEESVQNRIGELYKKQKNGGLSFDEKGELEKLRQTAASQFEFDEDNYKTYLSTINELEYLGVENAKEYVDALQQQAMLREAASQMQKDYAERESLLAKETLTEKEKTRLSVLQAKKIDGYISDIENDYGIQLKDGSLLSDQYILEDYKSKRDEYKRYLNDIGGYLDTYDGSFSIVNDYKKKQQKAKSEMDKILDTDSFASNFSYNWSLFWTEMTGSEDTDAAKYKKLSDEYQGYNTLIAEEKDKRIEAFNNMLDIAKEAKIDLSDIDTNSFDPNVIGDNDIFTQVYKRIKSQLDSSISDLESKIKKLEPEIQARLDNLGLEIDFGRNFDKIIIDGFKTKVDQLSTARSEMFSSGGLSTDSIMAVDEIFGDLDGYDSSKLFENTANGVRLNTEEFRKLNDEFKSINIDGLEAKMSDLGNQYIKTRDELYELTYGTDEYNAKARDLADIEKQMAANEELLSQYQGLFSAFQEWQRAESSGSERNMYETILSGWDTVKDEISRGWIDDGTREYLELLKGEKATIIDGNGNKKEINIATASAKQLKQVWKSLDDTIQHTTYSVQDFFTVDDEGNSTSQGVYNFLDAIGQMEEEKFLDEDGKPIDVIKRNSEGKIIGFDFQIAGGDEAIAKALGISEELVQIMKRAANDAGFVVTFDGSYEQLDVLKEKAETAVKEMNEILEAEGKATIDIDMDVDTVTEIQPQLDKIMEVFGKKDKNGNLTGEIDMSIKGADKAIGIARTLQSMLDEASRPVYMDIHVSEVEEKLRDPLSKLQQLRTYIEQEHQLKLSGGDTSELEKSKQQIYDYFETLDPEIKAKVGLVDNRGNGITEDTFSKLTGEQKIELGYVDENGKPIDDFSEAIEKKLNDGDLLIEATVDLQIEMADSLDILALGSLLEQGKISQEEYDKRIAVYLDAEVDSEDANIEIKKELKEYEKGGSVNLTLRPKVDASVLKDAGWEDVGEGVATVFTSTFSNEVGNVAMNFTPIIADENGNHIGTLSPDELQDYAEGVIAGTREDDLNLQIGAKFEGKDAIQQAEKAAQRIHELQESYYNLDGNTKEQNIQVIVETIGQGDVEALNSAMSGLTDEQVKAVAEAIGKGDVEALDTAIANMDGNVVQAIAQALGYDNVESLKNAVKNMQGNEVDAKANAIGKTDVDNLNSSIDTLKSKDGTKVTITTWFKKVFETITKGGKKKATQRTGADPAGNDSEVNGTANVNGTIGRAFKQGSWGTKDSGTALVGELGREVLVRGGRYYTIGDNGAEFIKYKKGDIIFNHVQSEQLFRNGKVTAGGGRAKALVGGTAFLNGSYPSSGAAFNNIKWDGYGEHNAPETDSKSKNINSGSKDKEFEEVIDWIEVILDRVERSIDKYEQQANNIYKSWSSRNEALDNQVSEIGKEIGLQQSAKQRYLDEADSVGLSETWAKKVRNGEIDIDDENDFDEDTAKKIKEYREWYEKALDCEEAIEELKETEASLYAQRFENIQARYDGILQGYEHTESMLNEYINQAEEQGHLVSTKYYEALINNEKQNIEQLKNEQAALIAERDRAVADGKITKYSEAWYEQCAAIDEVTQAIEEGNTALIEYNNSIRDIDWQKFDLIQERISDITAESEFLIELMSNKDLFDDDGKLTKQGAATMGLHAQNYNVAMYQSDDYGEEIAKLDKQIAKDPYDQELINRRRELIEAQRDSILAAEDEKNAIKDLVEEGINLELDALQEKIDKKNEELEAEKDLYDYQRQVLEQTEEIASLEKQMASYSNDDSEEAKAKIQELKVSLEEAKVDLQETEWDRYIDQQSQLLTSLYDEYELLLNQRLDDTNYLLSQVIDGVNATALALGEEGTITNALGVEGAIASAVVDAVSEQGGIHKILNKEVTAVGTKLSTAMNTIWNAEGAGNKVITKYGDGFQLQQTTTNEALGNIKSDVDAMAKKLGAKAQEKINEPETQSPTVSDPTKGTNGNKDNKGNDGGKKPSNGGDGKPRVGDRVKFVNGQYYYDSQGKKPLGSHNRGKYVYITKISDYSWSTYPIHISTGKKLGTGDLGWLKKEQISEYATGKKKISNNEYAWTQEKGREFIVRPSDGAILTPIARKDSVLNAKASNNIWDMANNPTDFIKNNLGLDTANIPNDVNINNQCVQNFENINFNMPNVHSYNELISEMQRDPKFEKLILAMTLDQVAGKSKLTKNKAIR